MRKYKDRIKVSKKIKPLVYSDRTLARLKVDETYYLSWEANWAYACKLVGLEKYPNETWVNVEVPTVAIDKKTGNNLTLLHTVKSNEIGVTPKQAVENQVMASGPI